VKPMLASDWHPEKVQFPVVVQPKFDGVRALNLFGKFTGRSLKPFKNKHVTAQFSRSALLGFDGEAAAAHEADELLCSKTTSALGTIEGAPYLVWWLFDYVTTETRDLPYLARYEALQRRIFEVSDEDSAPCPRSLSRTWTHSTRS
jgi:hypothetical protein